MFNWFTNGPQSKKGNDIKLFVLQAIIEKLIKNLNELNVDSLNEQKDDAVEMLSVLNDYMNSNTRTNHVDNKMIEMISESCSFLFNCYQHVKEQQIQ